MTYSISEICAMVDDAARVEALRIAEGRAPLRIIDYVSPVSVSSASDVAYAKMRDIARYSKKLSVITAKAPIVGGNDVK